MYKFHHIAMYVKDIDRSIEFYKAIGLTVKMTWGDIGKRAAMLDMGDGGCIELFENGESGTVADRTAGVWAHLALGTDKVDEMFNKAIAAGAKEKTAPFDIDIPSDPALPVRIAFVTGIDGEVIEFFHVR